MGGWADGWVGGWVDGWMGGWVDVWMGGLLGGGVLVSSVMSWVGAVYLRAFDSCYRLILYKSCN